MVLGNSVGNIVFRTRFRSRICEIFELFLEKIFSVGQCNKKRCSRNLQNATWNYGRSVWLRENLKATSGLGHSSAPEYVKILNTFFLKKVFFFVSVIYQTELVFLCVYQCSGKLVMSYKHFFCVLSRKTVRTHNVLDLFP